MDTEQKVTILLKEYEALRAEALARMNARFGFLGLAVGMMSLAYSRDSLTSLDILVVLAFLVAVWFYIGQLLHRLRKGLERVEAEINRLAGEELLVWETKSSSRLFGRVHGLFSGKR